MLGWGNGAAVVIGFGLDYFFGDPVWLYHPVRLMGLWLEKGEAVCRGWVKNEYLGGMILTVLLLLFSYLIPCGILKVLVGIHPFLAFAVESFFCFQILAAHSLKKESMAVYTALENKDLAKARVQLSRIVGRDTANLTPEQVVKATVETIAENTTDGVVAPLFYMVLGGAPWGFLYKGINTADSMIGYRSRCYIRFGRVAARLDDVANWFPARLAALCMLGAGGLLRLPVTRGFHVFKRDRYNHKSPNSAQTEAACAGLLSVQLAGNGYYQGELVEKPFIGDPVRPIGNGDIIHANRLMYLTSVISMVLLTGCKWVLLTILAI